MALPRCVSSNAYSMTIAWDEVPETDLYYIALSTDAASRPFALRTSVTTNLTFTDLRPSTTYFVSLKSHPSSEPTIAWAPGWRDPIGPIICNTTAVKDSAPFNVSRIGELDATSIHIAWRWPQNLDTASSMRFVPHSPSLNFEIGLLRVSHCTDCIISEAQMSLQEWDWSGSHVRSLQIRDYQWIHKRSSTATLQNLMPNSTYVVKVRVAGGNVNMTSDPAYFRTKQPGAMYTTTYRISEYAMDVDFLENHNSATAKAMPLYLMTCSDTGNCQPWNKTQFVKTDEDWDECESLLAELCPEVRGTGFNGCVECVDSHRDRVVATCGNYTDADMEHPGFPIHYYCGVGWPENLMYFSAITEYCVEHLPSPQSDPRWQGYAVHFLQF